MSAHRVVAVEDAARSRRRERVTRAAWLAAAAVLSLTLTVHPFTDPTALWHLALGQTIAAHGLPPLEPFSFLPSAHAWVGQSWLFDVLLAGMVGTGGATLASVVCGMLATAGLALAALATPRAARAPGPALACALLLGALVASQSLATPSTSVTLLGLGVVLLAISRLRDGTPGALWLLPPAFLLWANMDAGFAFGLMVMLVALLVVRDRRARRALTLALVASIVATMVNPYGPGVYAALVATVTDPAIAQLSPAFASPDFHTWWLRLFEADAALLITAWVVGGGPDRADAVLGVAAIALALWSAQLVPVFVVIALPQTARYGWRAWQLRVVPRLRTPPAPAARARLAIASAGAVLVAGATGVVLARDVSATAESSALRAAYPVAAADYYASHFSTQRVYSTDTWGAYLAQRFPTGRVVFVYDGSGTFGGAAAGQYTTVHLLQEGWQSLLRLDGVGVAIVGDASQEASALHEIGWTADCVDQGAGALVMSQPSPGSAAQAGAPLTVPPGVAACR